MGKGIKGIDELLDSCAKDIGEYSVFSTNKSCKTTQLQVILCHSFFLEERKKFIWLDAGCRMGFSMTENAPEIHVENYFTILRSLQYVMMHSDCQNYDVLTKRTYIK